LYLPCMANYPLVLKEEWRWIVKHHMFPKGQFDKNVRLC